MNQIQILGFSLPEYFTALDHKLKAAHYKSLDAIEDTLKFQNLASQDQINQVFNFLFYSHLNKF